MINGINNEDIWLRTFDSKDKEENFIQTDWMGSFV